MNKYSFKEILEKEIKIPVEQGDDLKILLERIDIPKIQRDYAQGRVSESEVRIRFLNAIFNKLSKNDAMEMDFVYGSIVENTKVFTPLDGQQRLTTLFLLYWYIGTKELEATERENLYRSLQKFTYETRTSSRRFCKELTKTKTTFSLHDKPSKEITNLFWFYKSYNQDPTVKSMLNMLDAIHEKYLAENKSLFQNLENLKFYILGLNGFKLTDELYVKMNARGKQLTDFENLKADLIKWMKDEKNQQKDDFNKKVKLGDREMPYYFSISQKIDTTWTAFFWQTTKDFDVTLKDKEGNLVFPNGKIVDPLFIRLFYRYCLQKFILSSAIDNKVMDRENDFIILYNEGKFQNFQVFENLLNHKIINDFELFFDKLQTNWFEIENSISPSWYENKKWTFLNNAITQPDRVVFLAISLFLEQNQSFDNEKFKQWMRIVWNIVENADVDSAESMVGTMKLIEELSEIPLLYAGLANSSYVIKSNAAKNQVAEERKKSTKIINEKITSGTYNWEKEFISAEKHPFFKGSVSFIITDDMTIDEFRHRKEMAFKVFDAKGINEKYRNNGHIFLRALISRFTDARQIIGQNFTDIDEKEHYLKKMLASNEVVRNTTREWFSLKNEEELMNALNKSVEQKSQIQGWDKNNEWEKVRIQRAHEALYKVPELQDWMQNESAIRFDWNGEHLYVSRPRSWYSWIMLDSCRNAVIKHLLSKGFETQQKINDMPFFKEGYIYLEGQIFDMDIKLTFDNAHTLKIEKKSENEEWKEIKSYNFVNEDDALIERLEQDLFDENNFKELVSNLVNID